MNFGNNIFSEISCFKLLEGVVFLVVDLTFLVVLFCAFPEGFPSHGYTSGHCPQTVIQRSSPVDSFLTGHNLDLHVSLVVFLQLSNGIPDFGFFTNSIT